MYEIEMNAITGEFLPCWQAAGKHLQHHAAKGDFAWLRAHPYPPVIEHLSFRVGNQLFFVRVEDVDGRVMGPAGVQGLLDVAAEANAHACILPMRKVSANGEWAPVHPGWGLLHASTSEDVNPPALGTHEKVVMSPWELQDFAVQVVRDQLAKEGLKIVSWQGRGSVDPSIWFVGKSGQLEWVVVRVVAYPANEADRPENWRSIEAGCSRSGHIGHFASVAVVSTDQPFKTDHETPVPLWRGHSMYVRYEGLK